AAPSLPSLGAGRPSLLLDRQGVGGAELDRVLDVGAYVLGRVLVEDVDLARLRHLEDGGGLGLAHAVALAQVTVDADAHHVLPSRRRYRAAQGCCSCTTILEWSLR